MVGDSDVRSLEYLRHLAGLVPGDDACECCKWAVEEIERLRDRAEPVIWMRGGYFRLQPVEDGWWLVYHLAPYDDALTVTLTDNGEPFASIDDAVMCGDAYLAGDALLRG